MEQDHIQHAREMVLEYLNTHHKDLDEEPYKLDEVHVIMVSTELNNWTFLIKTVPSNYHIYEVIWNNFKKELILHAYNRTDNA